MARNNFSQVSSVEIAAAVGAFKTILQLLAPTGIIVAVQEVTVSFDGIVNTAEPVEVEVLRQTTAGTGGSARNPLKTKDTSTALQVTGQEGPAGAWGAEPTAGDILGGIHVHPQAGMIYPIPFEGEFEIPGAGRLGLRIKAAAAVNCRATFRGEE